jgi:SAM-dependent methyltransferase
MISAVQHWDRVYGSRAIDQVSWFQAEPTMSLELIAAADPGPDAAIVDVGAGASRLVDELLARGYRNLTVLDVSEAALEVARGRLGPRAGEVEWITADLLAWRPSRSYDVWHDRALFHFLVTAEQRESYLATMRSAVVPGGAVIIATFADDGPEMCSGLATARYSPADLVTAVGSQFELEDSRREEHLTPAGVVQPFTWVLLRARLR